MIYERIIMNDIVQWFNNNQGFVSALLSTLTIALGVIAIIISVQTARLPFRKKVKLWGSIGYIFDSNILTPTIGKVFASACNVGNRDVYIKFLGFAIKKDDKKTMAKYDLIHNVHFENGNNRLLKVGEAMEIPYSFEHFIHTLATVDPNRMIYYYLEDSEGDVTTEKYITVGKFLSEYVQ